MTRIFKSSFVLNTKIFIKIKNQKDVLYNQVYNILRYLLSTAISLLLVKIITFNIDPEQFGMYGYVLAVLAFCGITTITGINKTLGGYVAKNYHGTVKETTKLSFKAGAMGVLVLLVFGLYSFIHKQNLTEAILFFMAAVVFLPYSVFPRYRSILAGLQRFKDLLMFDLLSRITLLLGAIIVVLLLNQGILAFGMSQLIIGTVFFIIFYSYATKQLSSTEVDKGFFRHSFIISLAGLGTQIITPGIQMYLNYALGSSALAYFIIATRMSKQIVNVAKPIMHPISMKLAKRNKIDYCKAVIKLIPLTLFIGLLLYSLLYVAIDIFGHYFISDDYDVALFYAKLLGLIILLAPTFSILNANVIFEKNNKAYAIALYSQQAATILGYIIFVGKYGIPAIALTNVVALTIHALIIAFFIAKEIKLASN